MLIREIDHALTTIHCTLDGMEAVIQMIMEVQTMDADAVGYLLLAPINTPLFTFTEQKGFWLWLSENSRLIATTILTFLMTCGIVSIISNIQEIRNMLVRAEEMTK